MRSQDASRHIENLVVQGDISYETAYNLVYHFSDEMLSNVLRHMGDHALRNSIFESLVNADRVRTARILSILMKTSSETAIMLLMQLDRDENAYILNLLEEFNPQDYSANIEGFYRHSGDGGIEVVTNLVQSRADY